MTQTTITVNGTEYRIEMTDSARMPYRLYGPRSAVLGLMRTVNNPAVLFAMNGRTGKTTSNYFTDKGGVLREMVRA